MSSNRFRTLFVPIIGTSWSLLSQIRSKYTNNWDNLPLDTTSDDNLPRFPCSRNAMSYNATKRLSLYQRCTRATLCVLIQHAAETVIECRVIVCGELSIFDNVFVQEIHESFFKCDRMRSRSRLWRSSRVTQHGGKLADVDPGLWETLTRT